MDDHRGAQITSLVTRASTGDKQAWDALVDRYAPLIWSICGRYRLSRADAEDAGQSVWLRPPPLHLLDAGSLPDQQVAAAGQELLAAERHATLREALSRLPQDGQQLIALLIADPPVPYAEISTRLGIPVGSIGPTRSRWLDGLRRDPAPTTPINAA
jgi:DNA-directed RNA polymerase specialized sigma24 family protein